MVKEKATDEEKEIFARVRKSIKNDKVMVQIRDDGVYIRLAGNDKDEAFTTHWANAFPFCKDKVADFSKVEYDYKPPITMCLSPQNIIDAFKEKYINDFGKMDDRCYFIVGMLLATFEDLIQPNSNQLNKYKNEQKIISNS